MALDAPEKTPPPVFTELDLVAAAPRRRHISEVIAEVMSDVPSEELEELPKDGASQVDHYLYGHPKR